MATLELEQSKKYDRLINALAIAIPVVVALLLGIRQKIASQTYEYCSGTVR